MKSNEEIFEEAVQYEEKGEQQESSEQAREYYEKAGEMYSRAHELDESDVDSLYNWARVLFLLMDYVPQHAGAEERLNLLDKSISRFRKVLEMQHNNADAMFNLAQGLTVRADLVEDVDDIVDAHGEAAQALQEAVSLYESVYELQENLHQQNTHGGGSTSGSTTLIAISKAPVTAFTLIETLTSLVDATRSLGEMLDQFEDVRLLYRAALSKISLAYGILAENTEAEENTPAIIQLYQSHASLLAALADRTYTDTGELDEKSYKTAIETLAKVVILDQDNVEAHCDLGDLFGGYAQAKIRTCTDQDISSQEKTIWELYTEATRCFQTALDYEPDNLTTLFKLGDIHFTRAQLPFAVARKQKTQLLKSAEYWYKHAVDLETGDLEGGWLPWAMSAWALAKWTDHMEKLTEAESILKLWVEQGGSLNLLKEIGKDNIVMPEDFITWASEILTQ
ncbi:hypothetical protein BGW37DRAFT_98809 [Umbelopsis sp. PMI_123]|nr:hypothetical protein BGW37DRAFT_98809 [Umbelopsis sp. PMI_123]